MKKIQTVILQATYKKYYQYFCRWCQWCQRDINDIIGKLPLAGTHCPCRAFTVCQSGMDSVLLFFDCPQTEKANHGKKKNEGNRKKNTITHQFILSKNMTPVTNFESDRNANWQSWQLIMLNKFNLKVYNKQPSKKNNSVILKMKKKQHAKKYKQ